MAENFRYYTVDVNAETESEENQFILLSELQNKPGAEETEEDRLTYQGEDNDIDTTDSERLYYNEIRKNPLLTSEEEIFLGEKIQAGISAQRVLAEYPRVSTNSSQLDDVVKQGLWAKDLLVTSNLRLVVSIAKRYVGRGLPRLDLIQEGNLGLFHAADMFDPKLGYRFSTYATWWIRQSILRSISDKSRTIRLPVHVNDTLYKVNKIVQRFVMQYGYEPKGEELKTLLEETEGFPKDKIELAKRIYESQIKSTPLPLDFTVDEGGAVLGEFIPNKEEDVAAEVVEFSQNKIIKELLEEILVPREYRIIVLRLGLLDGKKRTLQEVGEEFSVSRERIRQLEANALRKLRRHPRLRNILRQEEK